MISTKLVMLKKSSEKKVSLLEQRIEKKKTKSKQKKAEIEELKKSVKDFKSLNSQLQRDYKVLERKLETAEKQLSEGIYRNDPSSCDTLSEFWNVVSDVKQQLLTIEKGLEDGLSERTKQLTESLLMKDDQTFDLISEHELEKRNLKSNLKKQLTKVRDDYEEEISMLKTDLQQNIDNSISMNRTLNQLKTTEIYSRRNNEKIEVLEKELNAIRCKVSVKDLVIEDNLNTVDMEKKVILEYMRRIEDYEQDKHQLIRKIDLFKDWKKKVRKEREKLFSMIKELLKKFAKKKNSHDIKGAFTGLSDFDKGDLVRICSEIGVNLHQYF